MSESAGGSGEVLVVEDDAQILRLVYQLLEEEGYHVTPASGLDAALARLREQRFVLVVTDLFAGQEQEPLEGIEGLVVAVAPKPVGVAFGVAGGGEGCAGEWGGVRGAQAV